MKKWLKHIKNALLGKSSKATPTPDVVEESPEPIVEASKKDLSPEEKERQEQYEQVKQLLESDDLSNHQLAMMFVQSLELGFDQSFFDIVSASAHKLAFWIEEADAELLAPYKKLHIRHGFFKKYKDIFKLAEVLPNFLSLESFHWHAGPYWNQFPLVRAAAKLPNLRKLSFRDCKMFHLPDNIGEASKLEELDLFMNKLKELPDSFSKLSNLKRLNLGENNFRRFPRLLYYMDSIEGLDMHANPLQDISAKHFADLKNMQELRLPKKIAHYYKEVLRTSMPNVNFDTHYWNFNQ